MIQFRDVELDAIRELIQDINDTTVFERSSILEHDIGIQKQKFHELIESILQSTRLLQTISSGIKHADEVRRLYSMLNSPSDDRKADIKRVKKPTRLESSSHSVKRLGSLATGLLESLKENLADDDAMNSRGFLSSTRPIPSSVVPISRNSNSVLPKKTYLESAALNRQKESFITAKVVQPPTPVIDIGEKMDKLPSISSLTPENTFDCSIKPTPSPHENTLDSSIQPTPFPPKNTLDRSIQPTPSPPENTFHCSTKPTSSPPENTFDSSIQSTPSPENTLDRSIQPTSSPPENTLDSNIKRTSSPPENTLDRSIKLTSYSPENTLDCSVKPTSSPPENTSSLDLLSSVCSSPVPNFTTQNSPKNEKSPLKNKLPPIKIPLSKLSIPYNNNNNAPTTTTTTTNTNTTKRPSTGVIDSKKGIPSRYCAYYLHDVLIIITCIIANDPFAFKRLRTFVKFRPDDNRNAK